MAPPMRPESATPWRFRSFGRSLHGHQRMLDAERCAGRGAAGVETLGAGFEEWAGPRPKKSGVLLTNRSGPSFSELEALGRYLEGGRSRLERRGFPRSPPRAVLTLGPAPPANFH